MYILEKMKNALTFVINLFEELSGLAKIAVVLAVLLTIFNIGGNIYLSKKTQEINKTVDVFISNQKEAIETPANEDEFGSNSLIQLIDGIGHILKINLIILLSLIVAYIVYYLCKPLDFLRNIVKFLAEIDFDSYALKIVVIYDLLSIGFSLYTIYGFVNIK